MADSAPAESPRRRWIAAFDGLGKRGGAVLAPSPSATGGNAPVRRLAAMLSELRDRHIGDDAGRLKMAKRFEWVRNVGAILIVFAGWQLWGTSIGEHHAQAALAEQFRTLERTHSQAAPAATASNSPPAPQLIPADELLPEPPEGSVVAQIQIPAIDVDQYVVEGTAEADLANGPGHYIGTALPGQAGNLAIAGHRTTYGAPFNRLAELAQGDPVYITTTSGERLTYTITGTPTATSPSNVSVLNDFGDDRLTLTTCNPEYSAVQRLIAVGQLTSIQFPGAPTAPGAAGTASSAAPASTASPVAAGASPARSPAASPSRSPAASHATSHAASPARATDRTHPASRGVRRIIVNSPSWNLALLPVVAVVIALLVLLGLLNGTLAAYLTTAGSWLVLGPIWLGGLYMLFQLLQRCLPATI